MHCHEGRHLLPWGGMKAKVRVMMLCVLCACAQGAQEDDTIVELPGMQEDEMPEVEPLPDWMIDIPAEGQEGVARGLRPVEPQHYIVADEHVVSQSRMFSVSGGDALRMGAIASHADDVRNQFNKLLGIEDKWKYLVSIRLIGTTADAPRAKPIRTTVRVLGHEPSLQIRIYAGGGLSIVKLDEAIVSTLLYEYALRSIRADALPDYLEMPPWLVTGVQQALLWKQGRVDRRYYENLFNKGDMISPEEIVSAQNPETLDASSRQLYEVSCGVLVMGLLQRDGGAERLRNLLAESLTQEGEARQVITAHFHEMGVDENNFSKWWALALAALAMPQAMDVLTPLETEKQLHEALLVTGMDEEKHLPYTVSITELAELKKLPDWQQQARNCTEALTELSMRCFPGHRFIIMEYVRAIGELLEGASDEKVEAILEPLQNLREAYKEAAVRGRDYLDWFEITQLGSTGKGNFSSYMEAMRLLREDSPGPDTHISRYLDDIEALHSIKEGDELPERLRPTTTHHRTAK